MWADLERRVAVPLDQGERPLGRLLRSAPAGVLIDPNAIAHRAAEELPHRHAERLALDVPQGVFDTRNRAQYRRPRRKARAVVHQCPEMLDPQGVLAGDPRRKVVDRRDGGQVRTDRVRLADPMHPFIRRDLDEHKVATPHMCHKGLNAVNLHRISLHPNSPTVGADGKPGTPDRPWDTLAHQSQDGRTRLARLYLATLTATT